MKLLVRKISDVPEEAFLPPTRGHSDPVEAGEERTWELDVELRRGVYLEATDEVSRHGLKSARVLVGAKCVAYLGQVADETWELVERY
ncbi:MAG: hypothetical protein BWX71_01301 [Deltaproteobacteria bacterium ADurb.Bin072]|jgi:hypothetical protein|nr:MAG: hypothetical protein BWX71_01301 [Deltaproteobacteria bacterium ADurb.Bin072]